jgi:putative hydrolase of the HAD superfamily
MPTEATDPHVIFFDIGGVLLSNGWGHESRQRAAKQFGLSYPEMEELHHFIFNVYEIGRITLDEYLDVVVFNRSRDFSREQFTAFMFSCSVELPGMLPWLREWRKSCPCRIFSINNEGRELNDYRIEKFGLRDCFDGFISSCEVGMRKPDPGIFRLALGIVHARPEECLYFDDRAMLAGAAAKLGIRSYRHEGFASTTAMLEALRVEKKQ